MYSPQTIKNPLIEGIDVENQRSDQAEAIRIAYQDQITSNGLMASNATSATSALADSASITSHQALTLTSVRRTGSAILLFSLISYVVATSLNELSTDQKSRDSLLVGAVTVSFSLEMIKSFFNMSAALNKNFDLHFGMDIIQTFALILIALVFYASGKGENWSSVGYNAVITVPGIVFQLLINLVIPSSVHHNQRLNRVLRRYMKRDPLVSETELEAHARAENGHSGRWYNHLMLHLARLIILTSAMIAGSELFAQIPVSNKESVGGGLVKFFELCGAKSAAAIYAAALLTNEIIGMTLFLGAEWFKDMRPSYFTRLVTLVAMAGMFEGLSKVAPFLNKEDLVNLVFASWVTFFADLAVQYTVGPKIDESVNKFTASSVSLLSRHCLYAPVVENASSRSASISEYAESVHSGSNRSVLIKHVPRGRSASKISNKSQPGFLDDSLDESASQGSDRSEVDPYNVRTSFSQPPTYSR